MGSSSKNRHSYAKEAILCAAGSRLVWFVCLMVMTVTIGAVRNVWYQLALPAVFLGVYWKHLIFEVFLVSHIIEQQLGLFQWFSPVDDNLLLGAIPIKDDHHDQELKDLDVKLVLSIVEPFELECQTLMGKPVSAADWAALGIQQVVLPSQDFFPPSFETLDKGAKLLDRYLSEGHRVYVHCKSGRGRSASVVAAYMFRYKNLDMVTIQAKMKIRRSVVFDAKSSQMRNLLSYAETLRPGSQKL